MHKPGHIHHSIDDYQTWKSSWQNIKIQFNTQIALTQMETQSNLII